MTGWRDFEGRKLLSKGEATWELAGREFADGRFEVVDVAYNVTDP